MPWRTKKDVQRHNKKCAEIAACRKLWLKTANKYLNQTGSDAQGVIRANVKAKGWLQEHRFRKNPEEHGSMPNGWDETMSVHQPSPEVVAQLDLYREEMEGVAPGSLDALQVAQSWMDDTTKREDVFFFLDKAGLQWSVVDFPQAQQVVSVELVPGKLHRTWVVDNIDDDTGAQIEDASDWLFGLSEMSLNDYSGLTDFDVWAEVGPGSVMYHGAPLDDIASIQKHGLWAESKTRSPTNRSMRAAVFATPDESRAEEYGGAVFKIDLGAMKSAGFMPAAEHETGVDDAEHRRAIATRLGINDWHEDIESGLWDDTVAFYTNIPSQYVKLIDSGLRQENPTRAQNIIEGRGCLGREEAQEVVKSLKRSLGNFKRDRWINESTENGILRLFQGATQPARTKRSGRSYPNPEDRYNFIQKAIHMMQPMYAKGPGSREIISDILADRDIKDPRLGHIFGEEYRNIAARHNPVVPQTFFHVSLTKDENQILHQGLIPQIGPRAEDLDETEDRIFLFPSQSELDNALMNWLGEELENYEDEWITIFRVELPDGFPVFPTFEDEESWEWYTAERVPPQYLTVLRRESP